MSNNSDPEYERYANVDFSDAKPVSEIPALAELQAQHSSTTRISIQVDNETLAIFKAQASTKGLDYQALMNDALRQFAHS